MKISVRWGLIRWVVEKGSAMASEPLAEVPGLNALFARFVVKRLDL